MSRHIWSRCTGTSRFTNACIPHSWLSWHCQRTPSTSSAAHGVLQEDKTEQMESNISSQQHWTRQHWGARTESPHTVGWYMYIQRCMMVHIQKILGAFLLEHLSVHSSTAPQPAAAAKMGTQPNVPSDYYPGPALLNFMRAAPLPKQTDATRHC